VSVRNACETDLVSFRFEAKKFLKRNRRTLLCTPCNAVPDAKFSPAQLHTLLTKRSAPREKPTGQALHSSGESRHLFIDRASRYEPSSPIHGPIQHLYSFVNWLVVYITFFSIMAVLWIRIIFIWSGFGSGYSINFGPRFGSDFSIISDCL
jgi:hypothetical protein